MENFNDAEKNTSLLDSSVTPNIELKPVYDVPGLLKVVPIGRSKLYEEMGAGRLRSTKIGRRTLFMLDDVLAWWKGLRNNSQIEEKE